MLWGPGGILRVLGRCSGLQGDAQGHGGEGILGVLGGCLGPGMFGALGDAQNPRGMLGAMGD